MICHTCGKNVVTFKREVGGVKKHLCYDCMRKAPEQAKGFLSPLENIFTMKWKLVGDDGIEYIEEHEEVSLSDIEVIYGNNVQPIIWCKFWMKGRAFI
jgi:hypothetical protein